MAQVTARKRGKVWEYRFEIASIDGKRKQKSRGGFRTKAEAMKAGTEAYHLYETNGEVSKMIEMSVSDFIDVWINDYARPNLRPNTVETYINIIDKHIRPEIGGYRLRNITHSTLQHILNDMTKNYKRSTLYTVKNILQKVFTYAASTMRTVNPSDGLFIPKNTKNGENGVKSYSMDEADEMIGKMIGTEAYFPALVALHTGMRAGEVLALTWEDIDMENQTISVTKTIHYEGGKTFFGPPKSDKGFRVIHFGNELKGILHSLWIKQRQDELSYGEFYNYCYLDNQSVVIEKKNVHTTLKRIKPICTQENGAITLKPTLYRQARRKAGADFKFHNLRHTHATVLFDAGIDAKQIQERLGHATVSTTLDTYVDAMNKDMESAHAIDAAWTNRGQTAIFAE